MQGLRVGLLLAVVVVMAGALGPPRTAAQEPAAPAAAQGPGFDPADCATCHEQPAAMVGRTAHATVATACAACHTGVPDHLASVMDSGEPGPIGRIRKANPHEVDKTCLGCHDRQRQAAFKSSAHHRRGVSCISCHSVHAFASAQAQLKTARDASTCFTCHANQRAKTARVSHHPVREGLMDCASCHDPHGSRPRMVKEESVNEQCYSCHRDKRGPFLVEHAPARESCLNCHDPHGSNHERLLVSKQPFLCQRCHVSSHSSVLFDQRAMAGGPQQSALSVGRSCSNCHQMVHGTNHPSGFNLGR